MAFVVSLVVVLIATVCVLVQILRFEVWKRLPWFACYVGVELVGDVVQLVVGRIWPGKYVVVFWSCESAQVLLVLLAMRESFMGVLWRFVREWEFRWFVVRGSLVGVIVYAVVRAIYFGPVGASPVVAWIVGIETGIRWLVLVYGSIFLYEVTRYELQRLRPTQMAVVDGLMISSAGFLVSVGWRSAFGTKYGIVTELAGSVGYCLAAAVWFWNLGKQPVDELAGLSESEKMEKFRQRWGMTPQQMTAEIKRYRELVEMLRRKLK